jgi:tetratricopeptide (TPR) repeat protein
MLNVHELERRWLKYKIRYYVPITVAVVSVTILTAGALLFWPTEKVHLETPQIAQENNNMQNEQESEKTKQNISTNPVEAPVNRPVTNSRSQIEPSSASTQTALQPKPVNVQRQALQPSMSFIQNLEEDAIATFETESVPESISVVQTRPVQPSTKVIVDVPNSATDIEKAAPKTIEKPVASRPKPTISISQKDADDLNDVIKRFKTNKNPALSLFLARRYYDIGDFQSAYDYALKTNELDSNIEESWLIFAKSLVKLGQKNEALKILKSYANHSNSIRAKGLSDDIRTGTFQ